MPIKQIIRRLKPSAVASHLVFAGMLTLGLSGYAGAETVASTRQYDIPAGPLADALNRFAQQSGVSIVVDADKMQGLRTEGIHGSYGVDEGFNVLLHGSGYMIGKTAAGYVLLPAPDDANGSLLLPVLEVTAEARGGVHAGGDPVRGYAAKRSATATRSFTEVIDTPVSVQTVTRDLMNDQRPERLKDVVENISGVYEAMGPDGNTMDTFSIRGFLTDSYGATYLDGVKDFSRSPKETAGLERVEVLKGPAAIMYGRIEPGGMINRVSKLPQQESLTEIAQSLGSDKYSRTTLDSTGALTGDGEWLYRINAAFEDADGFKDYTHNRRLYIAPQVEWRPSAATMIRTGFEYLDDDRSWALTYGTIGDENGPVDIPVSRNLLDKDDSYEEENLTFKLDWSHAFSDDWRLQQRITYLDRASVAEASGITEADAAGNYTRDYWGWDDETVETLSTNIELAGTFETGAIDHNLVIGADYFSEEQDSGGFSFGGTPLNSNIHNPVYGNPYADDRDIVDWWYENHNKGVFVQDQLAMLEERLHLLLGIRRDLVDNTYTFMTFTSASEQYETTYRTGLLYKLRNDLSVYASYVEGFGSPNYDFTTGGQFETQTSHQIEAGTKWEINPELITTVAIYELVKDNLTMADPNNPLLTVLAGEATSQGLELDIAGRVNEHLDFTAAYAYIDANWTRSDLYQGEQVVGVPRHGLSLWGTYSIPATAWKVGAGARYRDDRLGVQRADYPDLYPYTLDPYTVFNLMTSYDFVVPDGVVKVQFNIDNVTDVEYFPSTYFGSVDRILQGEPRSLKLTASYIW